MGIFGTIKSKLGIGGVKVELQVPSQVAKDSSVVEGTLLLSSKTDQDVLDITVKVIETFTTGRGDDKKEKDFDMGEITIAGNFSMIAGEKKEIPFAAPFHLLKSNAEQLKEKGGTLGKIGSLGKFANNEKSEYFVEVDVDVKSAVLDPSDKKEIRLV